MRERIRSHVEAALRELGLDPGGAVQVDSPRDRSHGDLSTNVALVLGKRAGRPPRELAEAIAARLRSHADLGADVTLAGPGFINFTLHEGGVHAALAALLAAGSALGRTQDGAGRRLQLEFVSANPTGPLNVVSARAAAFGSTLGRLLQHAGWQVDCEFYVNDAGRQVEMLGASLRVRALEARGGEEPLPEDGYHGEYVRDLARAIPAAQADAWLALPQAESWRAFGAWAVERLLEQQRADLERFGVRFDRWFRETELHAGSAVTDALQALEAGGHVFREAGAAFFRSTAFGDDKDRVVVRAGGAPTYFLADVAYHRDKHARGYATVIDVWGPDHHGHIARMQAVARALGYPADWLEIVIIQWVKLLEGGEAIKMSKRSGRILTLGELLDELGPEGADVAKYFFLMRHQSSHLDFDLDLARQQSDANPVFYVKYAHARICSVVAKAAEAGLRLEALDAGGACPADVGLDRLQAPEELDLVKLLAEFAGLVARAAAAREPHRLTTYCEDLARAFHSFYHHHRVLQDDRELARARLALCHATRRVLAAALDLMSIRAPQSM